MLLTLEAPNARTRLGQPSRGSRIRFEITPFRWVDAADANLDTRHSIHVYTHMGPRAYAYALGSIHAIRV